MCLLAVVCELIRSTYTNFSPDAIYNLQCFVSLMFDSVCAFCHWTVWNKFFMFHALEYTFVLKVEIVCAYIACIDISKSSTTEQNEVHIIFFFIYNLDMTLIIILNWRYNNICFSCRDREVAGLDTVVPLETTAAYDIKAVISGVRTCITIEM